MESDEDESKKIIKKEKERDNGDNVEKVEGDTIVNPSTVSNSEKVEVDTSITAVVDPSAVSNSIKLSKPKFLCQPENYLLDYKKKNYGKFPQR